MRINVSDLDKIELFRRLYNQAKLQNISAVNLAVGLSMSDITYEEAKSLYNQLSGMIPLINDRAIRIDFNEEYILIDFYNEANGELAFEYVVDEIRNELSETDRIQTVTE